VTGLDVVDDNHFKISAKSGVGVERTVGSHKLITNKLIIDKLSVAELRAGGPHFYVRGPTCNKRLSQTKHDESIK